MNEGIEINPNESQGRAPAAVSETCLELDKDAVSIARHPLRAFSAVPLFYKLLVFVALASAGAVVFAIWVTSAHISRQGSGDPHWGIASVLIAVGLGATLLINFAVMRIAFRPVDSLEEAIGQVGLGRLSARARREMFSDARIDRLIDAFNEMAESLEGQRTQLAQLSSRVLAAHEEERRRVARELHDDAGQALTGLLLGLKALENVSDETERRERLATLRESASVTLAELRRLARNLRPPVLDDLGLGPALKALVDELAESFDLNIEQHIGNLRECLSKESEVVLYRIAQEALTNVAKHARARCAVVRLERDSATVRVAIEDDGAGFKATDPLKSAASGLGLHGMQDRVALVAGSLQIRSSPGEGTTVIAEVPVRPDES